MALPNILLSRVSGLIMYLETKGKEIKNNIAPPIILFGEYIKLENIKVQITITNDENRRLRVFSFIR